MHLDSSVLNAIPKPDEAMVDELLREELKNFRAKLVVLDDDPTGVQTVHDVYVYTSAEPELLKDAFEDDRRLFYILTNSRGLTAAQTEKLHRELADQVDRAAKAQGCDYYFISRSDSTLRGHFPLETSVLRECYERNTGIGIDGEVLCPFFLEGGRFTVDNVHYVRYGDELIPACETEFAKDPTFGYKALTMPEYIEEKTGGAFPASGVLCISLEELRAADLQGIEEKLMAVTDFRKIVVNAADEIDLKVFAIALYRAMEKGKHFMFRTAASIVKIMGGISSKPLLTAEEMLPEGKAENGNGGIIVAGSHTAKTTAQLKELESLPGIRMIELNASLVGQEEAFMQEVERCIREEEELIRQGLTACCYTSRKLISADTGDKEDELRLSMRISDAVQSLVGSLKVQPSFIIAKGGITSSEIGTKALGVKKALVLGQIEAGIPVWKTGPESRFPGVPYVIFPGNVGDEGALKRAAEKLM